jgi:glycosyltransferase involved in cell wall biosynthesis
MKVLMVTPSYCPIVGGSETAIRILTTKLNEFGIHTDVMTYNMIKKWEPGLNEERENNGLFTIFKEPALSLSSILGVNPLELLRIYVIPKPCFTRKYKDYDIIHFQGEADLSFMLFSYFSRKPKMFTSHANFVKYPRFKKIYKYFFSRLADLYIAHKSGFFSELKVPESKTMAFQSFGVDTELFHPDIEKKIDNLLLFVGRIINDKGLLILLDALSHVSIKTRLVVVGPKVESGYSKICFEKIAQINQDGFHGIDYLGPLGEVDLVPLYQKAALLVRPDTDGYSGGITTIEAFSCATPVIGTGNHVLKDRVNGLIVAPKNATALANAINELLSDKDLRNKYGSEGRKFAEEHFSWNTIVRRLVKIYEQFLDNQTD